jgi:hypothetical protein
MFVEQGIKPENKFWKYIVGSLILILASFIGQLPLMIGIIYETLFNGKAYPTNNTALMRFLIQCNVVFDVAFICIYNARIIMVVRNLHSQTMLSVTTSRKIWIGVE